MCIINVFFIVEVSFDKYIEATKTRRILLHAQFYWSLLYNIWLIALKKIAINFTNNEKCNIFKTKKIAKQNRCSNNFCLHANIVYFVVAAVVCDCVCYKWWFFLFFIMVNVRDVIYIFFLFEYQIIILLTTESGELIIGFSFPINIGKWTRMLSVKYVIICIDYISLDFRNLYLMLIQYQLNY